jgi:hypothetical protein
VRRIELASSDHFVALSWRQRDVKRPGFGVYDRVVLVENLHESVPKHSVRSRRVAPRESDPRRVPRPCADPALQVHETPLRDTFDGLACKTSIVSGAIRALAASSGLLLGSGCYPSCKHICTGIVELTAHLAVPPDSLTNAAVTLCRNSTCFTGQFGNVSGSGAGIYLRMPNLVNDVTAEVAPENNKAMVIPRQLLGAGEGRDGDVYRLSIVANPGPVLFDVTSPAAYVPGGTSCGGATCVDWSADLYP